MSRKHSIAEARGSLPKLVHEAESGKAIELTRRGKPVAVLIGREAYDRLTAGQRGFAEAYASFQREVNLRELEIDPDAVFGALRERTVGRKFAL